MEPEDKKSDLAAAEAEVLEESPKKRFQEQEAEEYDPYDHEALADEPND
jgi:hypothetical protein